MPDPLEHDDKFESLFQSEILTYLSLKVDIQPGARIVSKSWQQACQAYKTAWIEALDAKRPVVLLELASAKGKTLNGNTGKITGKRDEKTNRYPIVIENWLSGESETLTFKICNLNPNATHRADPEVETPNLIQYTENAKLRRSHGMTLDHMLMIARWESNIINGSPFPGSYVDFKNLPRNHPILQRMNANMWTWWTVPPKLAGIDSRGAISDVVCDNLMDNDPSIAMAKEDKLWPSDGEKGVHLIRNMVRAMRSWADQRVHETFWVSHQFKTGSVLTTYRDGEFGQVYLVKGIASVIAELGRAELPFCFRATLLPIYDLWTYDGMITVKYNVRPTTKLRKDLEAHVRKAMVEQKVSWRSPYTEQWQYPPPPFPPKKNCPDDEVELDWSKHEDGYSNPNINTEEEEEITEEHMEIARKIVRVAISKGGVDTTNSTENSLVIRRTGYSYAENPNGTAMITHGAGMLLAPMMFEVDHKRGEDPYDKYIPTYNLRESLNGLFEAAKRYPLSENIRPDELGVVRPLEKVLKQAFEEEGATAPSVDWYPPPSEEETAYASSFPGAY